MTWGLICTLDVAPASSGLLIPGHGKLTQSLGNDSIPVIRSVLIAKSGLG
jgi:hypothetical protein